MGAKYDGGTNAICWNVDIITNEKLTRHINFCPPVGWIRLCLVESLMENQNCFVGRRQEQVCQGSVGRRQVGRCLQMVGVCVTCTYGTLVGGWGQKGAQQANAKLTELT